mmetsp:Transcript_22739/g.36523  ORF Transcript_22739/g.36523 Transcript_22739/m.36523 type:complete len:214 (-) Transcript_22739:628-1269(-)
MTIAAALPDTQLDNMISKVEATCSFIKPRTYIVRRSRLRPGFFPDALWCRFPSSSHPHVPHDADMAHIAARCQPSGGVVEHIQVESLPLPHLPALRTLRDGYDISFFISNSCSCPVDGITAANYLARGRATGLCKHRTRMQVRYGVDYPAVLWEEEGRVSPVDLRPRVVETRDVILDHAGALLGVRQLAGDIHDEDVKRCNVLDVLSPCHIVA